MLVFAVMMSDNMNKRYSVFEQTEKECAMPLLILAFIVFISLAIFSYVGNHPTFFSSGKKEKKPEKHITDAESFEDIKKRARKAKIIKK